MMRADHTYVFIPGAWHGGWVFDPITEELVKSGRSCFSITLPGLEAESSGNEKFINLDSHIQYVLNIFESNSLSNVILCGHSYGGLVVAGVADRIPERVLGLVFIDAYIPKNGDSCWSLTSDEYRKRFVSGVAADGINVAVPEGSEERRRPHPLATLMQCLKLTGEYNAIGNKAFIYLSGWEGSPFTHQYERLKEASDWHVEVINSRHNVMAACPECLLEALLRIEQSFTRR